MDKAITIAVTNQKGGVAKTTSTANIGSELARRDYKVLLVDMDGQGSLTYLAGHNFETIDQGDALPALILPDLVQRGEGPLPLGSNLGCDLLPASPEMAGLDKDLIGVAGGQQRLRKALEPYTSIYDFILIDSGPKLGHATINCLVAADYVLVPIRANAMSSRGYMSLRETIETLREWETDAKDLEILGIFATQTKSKTKKVIEVENAFRRLAREGQESYLGSVRASVKVEEADDLRRSIREHKKDSKPAIDYANLTTTILKELERKGALNG